MSLGLCCGERAVLEWAQEWSGSSVQQPGPVSPLRENIDFANSGLSSWSESQLTLTQENTTSAKILLGWSRYRSNKVWLSRDVIYAAVIWTIFVKSQQRNEPWPKSCWCSCLEGSNSDGKKLSCYFSIISMQRGWWWSYWWWEETGVEQISEMGLGWFKITICAIWLLMVEDTYEWLVPYPELMKLLSTAWGGPGLNWIWTQIILWLNCPSSCSDHQSQWSKHWITMGLNNFR